MRYALARIKALFVREVVVFVQAEPDLNIAEQQQILENHARLLAGFYRHLIVQGVPEMLANDMTLQMQATLAGGNDDAGVWSE